MKPAVEKTLQELEEKGVIIQVDEPTEWISNTIAGVDGREGAGENMPRPNGSQ